MALGRSIKKRSKERLSKLSVKDFDDLREGESADIIESHEILGRSIEERSLKRTIRTQKTSDPPIEERVRLPRESGTKPS